MPKFFFGPAVKEAARARFRLFNITLPQGTQQSLQRIQPGGSFQAVSTAQALSGAAVTLAAASALRRAGTPAPAPAPAAPATATPMASPPALFRAASNSKEDVDYQIGMHEMFERMFDTLIDALEWGLNEYRQVAGLVDVRIDGPVASGGRLEGPPLAELIQRAPPVAGMGGWEAMVRNAVAHGFGRQWQAMASSVRVPALPWYPMFAAFPGPVAPPMPNVPIPFIVLQPDPVALSPESLKAAMRAELQGNMDYGMEFFESLALALQPALQVWKTAQMVAGVLGSGPVPTFAPPYVPVGPVVGGSVLRGAHISS